MPPRLRRASALVLYWENGRLVCENYLTRQKAAISPQVAELLDWFGTPRSPGQFPPGRSASELKSALAGLRRLGLIQEAPSRDEKRLDSWSWGAAARHFLFSTKDSHQPTPEKRRLEYASQLKRKGAPPPLYKTYPGARRVSLVKPTQPSTPGTRLLATIQNTRAFALRPMPLAHLSEIMFLTWGQRSVLRTPVWGKLVDKTSYSAGNRHPIEVYPIVVSVAGLRPGVYHYNVRDHCLELRQGGDFARQARLIGNSQAGIRKASVYFLMTAVVKRTMWKYRSDYALRALFFDAGHLSQSLYAAAQSLGWGACTTYALNHSLAEGLLGVDGVDEPFLALSMAGAPA